ncbi:fructose permease [Apilactobacillus micheneri]|uniref:Fructose permease n=1 Tax=Apilactobacillus micheneri TaxID=1899430 RepID=A0A2S2JIQ4_9LACO|nr:fructose permease [Apilactobacillus micheneri]TPR40721.1 fructose permease [Apilactobacillus micheneri]TPR42188.1 fructose permease [Apilactobacillus micheneri]TPR44843.1 fructose permease [Apilactobacillus micheneri]TPR45142.1 fructose permease [Apilactobacillus micheneri]TPR46484.1 fructose permease [Apilactobacillus micheneri]
MQKSADVKKSTKTPRTISWSSTIMYFVISLVINAMGNVLTLVTSVKIHPSFLGSAYWTAAENNLGFAVLGNGQWVLFWAFFGLGMLIAVFNAILVGHWSWSRIIGNAAFLGPFSLLINYFNGLVTQWLPEAHNIGMILLYVFLNFFGVALIAIAISIYQRVNIALHPADDLMQILRFKYCGGNAAKAMWFSYIPPTIMAIIAIIITHQFTNFGLGTVFAFFFQGGITGIADAFVFRNLKHQAIDVGSTKE